MWARNGLSHPRLETLEGRVHVRVAAPDRCRQRGARRPSLECYLLARHRAIDALLERAIEEHGVTQVIEVAAGLSPRGWRFTQRYGDRLTYIEADLPGMAARKRRALEQMGSLDDRHRVVEVDALRDDGPDSIAALAAELDRESGLAIITEGLLGYLRHATRSTGSGGASRGRCRASPRGRYISDLHLGVGAERADTRVSRCAVGVRARAGAPALRQRRSRRRTALRDAGFAGAKLYRAADVPGTRGRQRPRSAACAYT